jgi:hypothetical protein
MNIREPLETLNVVLNLDPHKILIFPNSLYDKELGNIDF